MIYENRDKLASQIEGDLLALLDEFYSLPEVWDDELTRQIHEWYANAEKVWPKRPYFSPSSTNSCPRELYMKAKGAKRDVTKAQPHQSRWRRLGTVVGDFIQEDILKIERNFEKKTGNAPRFKFVRNEDGTPMFEDFAKTNKLIEHNGEKFYLYGAPDGIMNYVTDDGEIVRVGLEIKSKQTTPARTSTYSLREPQQDHAKQCIAYSAMFDCDYYVVLYVNAAKKKWNMTEDEYEKTPDLRAFCMHITDEDRNGLFDELAENIKAVNSGNPPKLDIEKFRFNNFKTACANDLSEAEVDELETYAMAVKYSSLPSWKKQSIADDVETIKELRKEGAISNGERS